jgi:riboflavin synthase
MFTGIVGEIGVISALTDSSGERCITVEAPRTTSDLKVGDSVCVCGVCQTVVSRTDREFSVTAVPETLGRSTLGYLRVGSRVNLELSLSVGDRLGGHFVTGHVDTVGRIASKKPEGAGFRLTFEHDPGFSRLVVEKGSVAVDGVSLTVAGVSDGSFSVAVVPHTANATTLGSLKQGDSVNVEFDLIAKHLMRLSDPRGGVSMEMLTRAGFVSGGDEP